MNNLAVFKPYQHSQEYHQSLRIWRTDSFQHWSLLGLWEGLKVGTWGLRPEQSESTKWTTNNTDTGGMELLIDNMSYSRTGSCNSFLSMALFIDIQFINALLYWNSRLKAYQIVFIFNSKKYCLYTNTENIVT